MLGIDEGETDEGEGESGGKRFSWERGGREDAAALRGVSGGSTAIELPPLGEAGNGGREEGERGKDAAAALRGVRGGSEDPAREGVSGGREDAVLEAGEGVRGGRRDPGLGGIEAARAARESPSRGAPARRRKGNSATDSDEMSGNLYVEAGKGDSGTDNFGREEGEPEPLDRSRAIDDPAATDDPAKEEGALKDDGALTEEGTRDLSDEGVTDRTDRDLTEEGVLDPLNEEGLVLLRLNLGLSTTTSKTYFCFLFSLTYASNKSSSKRKIASRPNIFNFQYFLFEKYFILNLKLIL